MNAIEDVTIERKIINVTGKRQVTIPIKFYEKLGFGREVECFLTHDSVVIKPLAENDDNFSMEILKDLVSQGYGGEELLLKFAEQRINVKKAIGILIDEADEIAAGKCDTVSTKDIFGED